MAINTTPPGSGDASAKSKNTKIELRNTAKGKPGTANDDCIHPCSINYMDSVREHLCI